MYFFYLRIAMIKRKAKPFKPVDFSKLAQQKYIDVNNALQKIDKYVATQPLKRLILLPGLVVYTWDFENNSYNIGFTKFIYLWGIFGMDRYQ